jgi:hypothetical protein
VKRDNGASNGASNRASNGASNGLLCQVDFYTLPLLLQIGDWMMIASRPQLLFGLLRLERALEQALEQFCLLLYW